MKRISYENRSQNDRRGLNALGVEYFDENALALLRPKYPQIPAAAKALIFIEEEISREREGQYLAEWGGLLEKFGAIDSWTADNPKKEKEFKEFRHALPEAVNEIVKRRGFSKVGTDMAVPADKFPEMFKYYYEILAKTSMEHLIFGHIGDNHLHVNILPRSEEEVQAAKGLYLDFVRKAVGLGGTPSAEHGIGKLKHLFLREMVGEAGIMEMVRIKKILDPACILGRGNIFPDNLL